ncbi:MAG: transcription antitermination factor NusB [Hyphomonadaceae bacterium]|nr:transcription antitermination factor NusB [Hyphomonadaceae bacterium]
MTTAAGVATARRAAAVLVAEVLDHGRTLDDALAASRSFAALEGRDRAFARAIASTTLRRLGGVDEILGGFLQRPLPESAALARGILRTGAAQLLAMGSPPHAVVSEAVAVAHAARNAAPYAGLINAVLRRVDREGRDLFSALPPGADLPDWIFARWRAAYGDDAAAAIARALRAEPPLDITPKSDVDGWAARLGGKVIDGRTVRLDSGGDVAALPGFAEGAWWVQDAAASAPVGLLGDVAGLRIADLCAAPGGKTMQLANAGASVTAVDVSSHRLGRVRENLARTGLPADLVEADVLSWAPDALFDVVLLDAPCSATGTLRRHPDVAWLRRPADIAALAAIQAAMLDRAIALTRPGGRILYVVCSLEPEEGPGAIEAALSRHSGAVAPAEPVLHTTPASRPDEGGMDGFYARVLTRT